MYYKYRLHINNSRLIVCKVGKAEQHIQYLPFGELSVSQRNSTYNSRYKFTAKEHDTETNYTYFGARYYDSDASIWLSVDPMADQRSWVSPYSYCQNNPIGRVDPTGALDEEYIVTVDKNVCEKKRISTLGGNDIDLYNYVGGKLDGKTKTKSNGTGKRKSRGLYR